MRDDPALLILQRVILQLHFKQFHNTVGPAGCLREKKLTKHTKCSPYSITVNFLKFVKLDNLPNKDRFDYLDIMRHIL